MATITRATLEEFLALPESKPYCELLDGVVVEKAMPNALHAGLALRLGALLWLHQQQTNTFHVGTEMRHIDAAGGWVFIPDISVLLKSRSAESLSQLPDPVPFPPDFAIEVLSPGDRPGMILRRIEAYRIAGATLLWLVDPEAEKVTVWQRGEEPFVATPGLPLSGAPILPGFEVDIAALFETLHQT